MYQNNEALLSDLKLVSSCLYDFLQGNFDEPLHSLPDSKVDDLIGGDGMSQEDPNRFYVMYGKACLLINKAVLTFSIQDIDAAKNSVNEAKNSAYKSTAGWWANRQKNIDYYSLVQLHAQLVYGDCEFLYGLLAILKAVVLLHKARGELNQNHITQTSQTPEKLYPKDVGQKLPAEEEREKEVSSPVIPAVAHFYGAECLYCVAEPGGVTFMKSVSILYNHFSRLAHAGLSFMRAHSMFLHLAEILKSTSSSAKASCELELLSELNCGVKMMLGSIQLFSAVLPQKALGLLQIVRYLQPDKTAGIKLLREAQQLRGMRQILPSTCLLTYQLVFLQHIGPANETDINICSEALDVMAKLLSSNSFLVQYFTGLHLTVVRNDLSKGKTTFSSILNELEHKVFLQVKLIAHFELLWVNARELNWAQAAFHAKILSQQTYWTQAYFTYLHALFEVCNACDEMTKDKMELSQSRLIADLKLRSRLADLQKMFACQSQIKVVAVDRLAVLRSSQLLENIHICYLLALEVIFWNNEFRHLEAFDEDTRILLTKTKGIIYQKLQCLDALRKSISLPSLDKSNEVIVFIVFALEICSAKQSRNSELVATCFEIVRKLLHDEMRVEHDCVLTPLLFFLFLKVCCEYLTCAVQQNVDIPLSEGVEFNEESSKPIVYYLIRESESEKSKQNKSLCSVASLEKCCEAFSKLMKRAKDSATFSDCNSVVSGRAHYFFRSLRFDYQKVLDVLN